LNAKDILGRRGEQLAVEHLQRAGLRILDRNWRCADGEIDIVAAERRALVVCEVKTRSGVRYGTPLEAITRQKREPAAAACDPLAGRARDPVRRDTHRRGGRAAVRVR
jgi:Holliday junction resolvase-like predicted endonuclease